VEDEKQTTYYQGNMGGRGDKERQDLYRMTVFCHMVSFSKFSGLHSQQQDCWLNGLQTFGVKIPLELTGYISEQRVAFNMKIKWL